MSCLVARGECLYEILGVEKGAPQDAVAKGYKKQALRYHPDRTRSKEGDENDTMFKKIGFAYSVLKDAAKRRTYDKTGEFGDAVIDEASISELMRTMFGNVTEEGIDSFMDKHKGTEEEAAEVAAAYTKTKGNWVKMLDMLYIDDQFEEEEDRVAGIVQGKIDAGELAATAQWKKTNPACPTVKATPAYKKRRARRVKEAEAAQRQKATLKAKEDALEKKDVGDMTHEEQLQVAMKDLMGGTFEDVFKKLAAKHGVDPADEPDDAAFEAARKRMKERNAAKKAQTAKKPSVKKAKKRTADEVEEEEDTAVVTVSAPPAMRKKVAKKRAKRN
eukprot:TRINITY_DN2268_c0_g4_i1.p2 TRINITY_DN2268_c0_g4~~TRINITY_DN2268_c0_g4_i1.p2  ORF type:complete len:331 (+),score=180.30 TRINITY_DN2268_c0_g4_i1:69-1061(+)